MWFVVVIVHGGAHRAVPAPVPVSAGAGVPFLINAIRGKSQAAGRQVNAKGQENVPHNRYQRGFQAGSRIAKTFGLTYDCIRMAALNCLCARHGART